LVNVGKATIIISMFLAILISPHLGIDKKGGFQYIQEYTGFVSPGIFAMFILGFFWKKATSSAAMFATVGGFILSVLFKFLPNMVNLSFLHPFGFAVKNAEGVYEIPFIDRMGFVFIICILAMYIISILENRAGVIPKGLEVDTKMFRVHSGFAVGAILIIGVVTALYLLFW
jgi:SSS family solute:Na+ symporter